MIGRIRRFAVVAAIAAGLLGVGATAAQATTAHTAATHSAPTLRTAPPTMLSAASNTAIPQFSGCGWNPANNSKIPASYNEPGVNIRTGADTSCTIIGEGYPGQSVTVRCAWFNSGDGLWWDYVTDNTTGKKGWSAEEYLNWSGFALVC